MVYACDSELPLSLKTGSKLFRVVEVGGHKPVTCIITTDMNYSLSTEISQILFSNDLIIVTLSLSYWYSGSDVELDCINSAA